MRVRLAALAACVVACSAASSAAATDRLTLDDAFARVAASHPDLRLFGARGDVLIAERERAAQRPALVAGATLENALGSGEYGGRDSRRMLSGTVSSLPRWCQPAPSQMTTAMELGVT